MNSQKIAKQMVHFQRNFFTSAFYAAATIQDQTQQVARMAVNQMYWLPEASRQSFHEFSDTLKKGRDDFKKCIDEGFAAAERLF